MKQDILWFVAIFTCLFGQVAQGGTQYNYDTQHRLSKVIYDDGTRIAYNYDASGNRSQRVISAISDFDIDGEIDIVDLATLAQQWLETEGELSANIAPWPNVDNIVDFQDFASFAQHWIEGAD